MVVHDAFKILVHKAEGLRYADLDKKSDPYAEIKFPDDSAVFCTIQDYKHPHVWRTKTIEGKLNPTWDETVTALVLGSVKTIPIHIYDKDPLGTDSLGHIDIPIERDQPFVVHDAWYDIKGKDQTGKIHVSYQIIPFEQAALMSAGKDTLQTKMNEALVAKNAAEGQVTVLKAENVEAQRDIDELNNEVKKLELANKTLAASEQALKTAMEQAATSGKGDVAKLTAQIGALSAEVATLQGEVKGLEDENERLEEQMASNFQVGGKEEARKAANKAKKEAKKVEKEAAKIGSKIKNLF